MHSLRKIRRVTIGRTWEVIGMGGRSKSVPYERSLQIPIYRALALRGAPGFTIPSQRTTPSQLNRLNSERTQAVLNCYGKNQYIFAPAGMWLSSIRRCSFSSPSSWWTAEISIPQDSMPIMGLGGRLVMATQVLPTSSSGS